MDPDIFFQTIEDKPRLVFGQNLSKVGGGAGSGAIPASNEVTEDELMVTDGTPGVDRIPFTSCSLLAQNFSCHVSMLSSISV